MAQVQRPVFLFACGWRSGSTLVQRLLNSHPELMVWGENRGLVEHLRQALLLREEFEGLSQKQADNLERDGSAAAWIPMLNPPLERLADGLRDLLVGYFGATPDGPARRWGFKEVRYDADVARFLYRLFPESRFVFLVRHPQDCLASARATQSEKGGLLQQAGGPEAFLDHWTRLARSFDEARDLPASSIVYETMIEDPESTIADLAKHLEVDPGGFDREVFAHKSRGWKRDPELLPEDHRALAAPELWQTAARFGYSARRSPGWLARVRARLTG